MTEKHTCRPGEKDAIGIRSYGCRFAFISKDYASLFNEIRAE